MAAKKRLDVVRLGIVAYPQASELQSLLVQKRPAGEISNTLLSLQHPATYTVGKRKTLHNLLASPATLASLGAEVHISERGGDITFHGPHQAVLYPIIALTEMKLGARRYVEGLEDTMIRAAAIYGVQAQGRFKRRTGIWVEDRKLGAIGVRISSGNISSHGLAFNIDPDLELFSHIVPCGIPDKEVTSLRKESAVDLPDEEVVTEQLIDCFADVFNFEKHYIELDEIGI
jgi:lipoate-protein ligase B